MEIISEILRLLVKGEYVSEYASTYETLLNLDLSTVDYLDDTHEAPKNIHSSITDTTITIKKLWEASPLPPSPRAAHSPSAYDLEATPLPRQQSPPELPVGNRSQTPPLQPHLSISTLPSARINESASPNQDEVDQAACVIIVDVSTRGSGVYKCLFGLKCTKGGVKEG
ncbi:hypothetical protein F5Y10DRAFT_43095 [Nemania abortiva]|nr:hypothetical protein F5Y10DRAFT_43095 [Nemania abortiva]